MNKSCVIASVVLLSINLGLCPLHAQKTIDRAFSVQPGGELLLDTDAGDVILNGNPTSQVKIHIESDCDLAGKIDFTFSQNGNRVEVNGKAREVSRFLGLLRGRQFDGHLRITIEIPQSFNPSIQTSGGDVEAAGIIGETGLQTSGGNVSAARITGSVHLGTSGGDIHAEEINGPLAASTSGGEVTARGIGGACNLSTSGGDIEAFAVQGDCAIETSGGSITADSLGGSLNAETSGGSIEACLRSQPRSACGLSTSGGDITLTVPTSISAELSAHTSGGSVKSDLPVKVFSAEEGEMDGTLGQGGPALTLRTSGGNIRLRVLK